MMIHNKRRRARQIHNNSSMFLSGANFGLQYVYRDTPRRSERMRPSWLKLGSGIPPLPWLRCAQLATVSVLLVRERLLDNSAHYKLKMQFTRGYINFEETTKKLPRRTRDNVLTMVGCPNLFSRINLISHAFTAIVTLVSVNPIFQSFPVSSVFPGVSSLSKP
jgi:hypothetical protein